MSLLQIRRPTMPPQESSAHMAGFIHVGKTGGSSISQLLRNGCSSFSKTAGPCRNVTNETIVSQKVEHYYHVADFWRLPQTLHQTYLVSVRDVYDRSVSSLLYLHPANVQYYNDVRMTKKQKYFGPLAYQCFPTLEVFAHLVGQKQQEQNRNRENQNNGDDGGDEMNTYSCDYPYPPSMVEVGDCAALACATWQGKVRFFSHLFFNYRNIVHTKLPSSSSSLSSSSSSLVSSGSNGNDAIKAKSATSATATLVPRSIFVIRQEHLWEDWIEVNRLWGQQEEIVIPSTHHNQRNVTGVSLPVSRSVSLEGRQMLCSALESEYEAYFRLLSRAMNMKDSDLDDCRRIAERNCPNLDMVSIVARARRVERYR